MRQDGDTDSLQNCSFNTSDEQEDEEEEDTEPKLTYDRIGNDVMTILQTDTATCLTVYEKVISKLFKNF